MSKYSSYKKAQLMTENWRRYLTEDEGSLDPAAAAEAAKTPEVQELADVAEEDPNVQAALAAVMDELAAAEGLEEGFGKPESYRGGGLESSQDADDAEAHLAGLAGSGAGFFGALGAIGAVQNTAAYAALLSALEISAGAAMGVAVPAAALGAVAGVLLMRKSQRQKE